MDLMVQETQKWLNKTYIGIYPYTHIPEDGITGWTTINALITALQIEIGIPEPNGNFGPATTEKCPTLSINSDSSDPKVQHQIYILQGALFCKGYNPTGLTGTFGENTKAAVKKLQSDAGISNPDGIATPMIFKALLNMDAFVLINNGTLKGDVNIRIIQQNLNRDYNSVIGLIPCDGLYSRSTNKALILGLQIEEGETKPDGIWGKNTASKCPVLSIGSTKKKFILLLQYALYCSGFNPNGFDGGYGDGVKNAVTRFQNFCGLKGDGIAGSQTFASLLVSTGDNSRKGTMCDCATTITAEKAQTLKNNGYKSVGRYITGTYRMTQSEIKTILNVGLNIFPIFETGGYKLSYFSENQGTIDASKATMLAKSFGFPDETIIYFAVDFDAIDYDVTTAVIPYFKGISDWFQSNSIYKIGIYAARSVCSRVSAKGYSCSSFVCDMSTGFSGNLGYSLPADWAIDQISTITIGSGDGQIEIDNNISNGKNMGVSKVNIIDDVLSLIKSLDIAAKEYFNTTAYDMNRGVLNLLRYYRYNDLQWLGTLGDDDSLFIRYVTLNRSELLNKIIPYIQRNYTVAAFIHDKETDLPHLAATTLGYCSSPIVPDFWIGWGGDLATAMSDVTKLLTLQTSETKKTTQELAVEVIGSDSYSCSRIDIENDIDAIYLANKIESNTIGNLIGNYFETVDGTTRREILLNDLGFTSTATVEDLNDKIVEMMAGTSGFLFPFEGVALKHKAKYNSIEPTNEVINAVTLAFSQYILNKL